MIKTVSILVTGKVQGVFYRQSTRDTALQLGITGTVVNQSDGSVSIVATGQSDRLEILVDWCGRGPAAAEVFEVQVKDLPLQEFSGFSIIRA